MNIFKSINNNAQSSTTTGFGSSASSYGGRFINKDGSANIEKRGLSFFGRISWYHTLVNMPGWKFLGIIFLFYTIINFIFALLYYSIGVENLNGIGTTGSEWVKFGKAYFFSAQTFTTVGYGHISPTGVITSAVAATEALTGLLSFAIATGLFYGRFSRPKAHLIFSHNALISPYKGGKAIMMRVASHKNTNLLDAEVRVTLGIVVEENGIPVNKFYQLPLEMNKISSMSLSWTLVHPIDENSPLHGFAEEDFRLIEGEFILYVKAFDDLYSNTVAISTSYTFDEVVYGAKFEMMYDENDDQSKTILYLDKINNFRKVELP